MCVWTEKRLNQTICLSKLIAFEETWWQMCREVSSSSKIENFYIYSLKLLFQNCITFLLLWNTTVHFVLFRSMKVDGDWSKKVQKGQKKSSIKIIYEEQTAIVLLFFHRRKNDMRVNIFEGELSFQHNMRAFRTAATFS